MFGAVLAARRFLDVGVGGLAFAALTLAVVRPVAIVLALLGSGLSWREQAAAAWFGPKGFASVVYGILIARSDVPGGDRLLHLVGATILLSIVAHSSTDVVVARWFRKGEAGVDTSARMAPRQA